MEKLKGAWSWVIGVIVGISFLLIFRRKKVTVVREPDMTEAAHAARKRINAELVEAYKESNEEVSSHKSTADALNSLYDLGGSSETPGSETGTL